MAMILRLNENERNTVVRALAMLAEDYRTIGDCAISEYLRREFREEATAVSDLAGRAAGLQESPSTEVFLAEIRALMNDGRKIDAIKYVRAHRNFGLKEAKDFVESVGL